MAGWAWYGRKFWNSLHFVDRIEELWLDDVLSKERVLKLMPQSVFTYEQALDIEVEEARNGMVALGYPLAPAPEAPRRSDFLQRNASNDPSD